MTSGWPTRPGPSPLERVSPPGAMVGDGGAPRAAGGRSRGRAGARRAARADAHRFVDLQGREDQRSAVARTEDGRPAGADRRHTGGEGMLHGGDLVDPEAHPEGGGDRRLEVVGDLAGAALRLARGHDEASIAGSRIERDLGHAVAQDEGHVTGRFGKAPPALAFADLAALAPQDQWAAMFVDG